jgi:predicted transcriptional regulator
MATITISVDDETERKFREVVTRMHGKRKGALGEATTEALNLWVKEKKQEEISRTALILMEQEYDLGVRHYRTREDLHGRLTSVD